MFIKYDNKIYLILYNKIICFFFFLVIYYIKEKWMSTMKLLFFKGVLVGYKIIKLQTSY